MTAPGLRSSDRDPHRPLSAVRPVCASVALESWAAIDGDADGDGRPRVVLPATWLALLIHIGPRGNGSGRIDEWRRHGAG